MQAKRDDADRVRPLHELAVFNSDALDGELSGRLNP
jgi:hypothetical protein